MTYWALVLLATALPALFLFIAALPPQISWKERRRWSGESHAAAILREISSEDFGSLGRALCRSQVRQYRRLILGDLQNLARSGTRNKLLLGVLGVIFLPSDLLLRLKSLIWPSGTDLHPLLNWEIQLRRWLDAETA